LVLRDGDRYPAMAIREVGGIGRSNFEVRHQNPERRFAFDDRRGETELCAAPSEAELQRRHGFSPAAHELDIYGTCRRCA